MENKIYTQAPLPFMGQKRRFLNDFKLALDQFKDARIFVDLFGGSGLLSHVAKRARPNCRIIYNDYDDYHIRLANIDRTNQMLARLRILVEGATPDKRLPDSYRDRILSYFADQELEGFVDYITLSSSLLFSMNYATTLESFAKQTMYNCVRKADYNGSGYLDGLEVVKYDYKELFEQFKSEPGVVFFVDPPYLSTESGVYKNYWRLSDYLDVLNVIKDTSYFYFTSNKSSILELCEWLELNLSAVNPFRGSTFKGMQVSVNYSSSYSDIMLYKNQNTNASGPLKVPDFQTTIS